MKNNQNKKKFDHDKISRLEPNQIFVFGSNLAGRHGAGAAKFALINFGAIYGIGSGLMGKSYGIPTKDLNIKVLPLKEINKYVDIFNEFAVKHTEFEFLVTKIGCGLSGYLPENIAPFFKNSPSNVLLNKYFFYELYGK